MNNFKKNSIEEENITEPITKELENNNLVELGALPDPWVLQYYRNMSARIIYLTADIDDSLVQYIKLIHQWNIDDIGIPVEERVPIKILIHSYGGDGSLALAMVDTIKASTTPIKICVIGVAMSAAAIILLAAPRENRYIMASSTVLLHQGSNATAGSAEAVLAANSDYKRFLDIMKKHIADSTDIPSATLNRKWKTEWYLYKEEILQYGIATKVVENLDEFFK